MKQVIAGLLCCMIASTYADLAIEWKNVGTGIQDDTSSFISGNLVQLLWSTSDSFAPASPGGSVSNPSEFILDEQLVVNPIGLWPPSGITVYTNDEVGGNEINSGYFMTRIFQTAGAEADSYFYDTDPVAASAYVFDPFLAATVYTEEATGLPMGSIINITSAGTTVIPEPSSLGLLIVFSAGIQFARRLFHS